MDAPTEHPEATLIEPTTNTLIIENGGKVIWRGDIQLLADVLERERLRQIEEGTLGELIE